MVETLKTLGVPGTTSFNSEKVAWVLRELIIDFLHRYKDRYPYST